MLLNNVRVTFECCLVKLLKNYFSDVYFNLSLRGYVNTYINDACKSSQNSNRSPIYEYRGPGGSMS